MTTTRAGFVFVAATLVVAVTAPGAGAQSAPRPASTVATHRVQRGPGKIADYWTGRRMRRAEPLDIVLSGSGKARSAALGSAAPTKQRRSHIDYTSTDVTNPEAVGNRTNGVVFFTDPSVPPPNDFRCSGTAVDAANRSLVITAGHCVFFGKFATNWIFKPGYHDGTSPFGTWTAKQLSAPTGWTSSFDCPSDPEVNCPNFDFDLGAAVTLRDPAGRGLEDAVGARGIAFNQPRNQRYNAYGYPADPNTGVIPPNFFGGPPFGEKQWTCASSYGGDDVADQRGGPAPMRIGCDMTGGSSGGSWVAGNAVEGLNSYGYATQPEHMYGPHFGTAAECLYFDASELVPRPADAQLLKHPKRKSRKRKAKFNFSVAGGPDAYLACRQFSFQCRLDDGGWKDCSSGRVTYRKLKRRRKHVFRVRALEVDGDAHGPATKFSFKVKKKKRG